jgi:hypothetical protein
MDSVIGREKGRKRKDCCHVIAMCGAIWGRIASAIRHNKEKCHGSLGRVARIAVGITGRHVMCRLQSGTKMSMDCTKIRGTFVPSASEVAGFGEAMSRKSNRQWRVWHQPFVLVELATLCGFTDPFQAQVCNCCSCCGHRKNWPPEHQNCCSSQI